MLDTHAHLLIPLCHFPQEGATPTAAQEMLLSARIRNANFTGNSAVGIGGALYSIASDTSLGPAVAFISNLAGDSVRNDGA